MHWRKVLWWSYAFLYLQVQCEHEHNTHLIAAQGTQQRMERSAWDATQDNTRFNQAYSTTIPFWQVWWRPAASPHRIVPSSLIAPPLQALLSFAYPFPLALRTSNVPSCTTTPPEWEKKECTYVCLLHYSFVFFPHLLFVNVVFSVTPAIKCNECLVIIMGLTSRLVNVVWSLSLLSSSWLSIVYSLVYLRFLFCSVVCFH